jgi:hypothetical protein
MSRRYIDLDSATRNRVTYPKVGDFVVQVNAPIKNTPETALDPIINAFPYEVNLCSGGSTVTQIAMSVVSSAINNFYKNSFLEINGEFRLIINYDSTTQISTVTPAFSVAPPALTEYTVRKGLPIIRNITGGISPSLNKIILNAGASSKDNFYVGNYVFLPGSTAPITYEYKRIIAYNGTTKVATVAGNFLSIIAAGTTFEIQRFTKDNVIPMRYIGTSIFNNPVCQSINLINIVIPNRNINGGYGGTLENYSHIYVAIYSEKMNSYQNPIISNGQVNNSNILFKVPVTYLPGASFLTLTYSGMNQSVAFRENDDLHFTVYLPTGDILDFEPFNQYTYFNGFGFPIDSDPLVQISAVFEVTRSE